jgi:copper(I)-binding protein
MKRILFAAALTLSTGNAFAGGPVILGGLELDGAWARATPPKAPTAAAYLTIANHGAEADRLVGIASPRAERAQIHIMDVSDGVMTMRPVEEGLEIPAGDRVTLAPDGAHIMLIGLDAVLIAGSSLPIRLTFEKAGSIEIECDVLPFGSGGPQARSHEGTK